MSSFLNNLTISPIPANLDPRLFLGNSGISNNTGLNNFPSSFPENALTGFNPNIFAGQPTISLGIGNGTPNIFLGASFPGNNGTITNLPMFPSAIGTGGSTITTDPLALITNPTGSLFTPPGSSITGLGFNGLGITPTLGTGNISGLGTILQMLVQLLTVLGPALANRQTQTQPAVTPQPPKKENPEVEELKKELEKERERGKELEREINNKPAPAPAPNPAPNPAPAPAPLSAQDQAINALRDIGNNGQFISDARGGLDYINDTDYNNGITVGDLKAWIRQGVQGKDKVAAEALIRFYEQNGDDFRITVRDLNSLLGIETGQNPQPPAPQQTNPPLDYNNLSEGSFAQEYGSISGFVQAMTPGQTGRIPKQVLENKLASETDSNKKILIQNVLDHYDRIFPAVGGRGMDPTPAQKRLEDWYN